MCKCYNDNLIWIDLEMTGLNPDINRIIEIATIVTDKNLNILAEGPNIVVYQEDKCLDSMDDWNLRVHESTGLINKVKNSLISEFDAELFTINFLKKWIPKGFSPICGSTVGQDRRFLFKYMPDLESYFHYRYIDVSSLRELFKRWFPDILRFYKKTAHSALLDIKHSIRELIYYRGFFVNRK